MHSGIFFHYMYSGTGVLISTDSEGEVRRYSVGPGQGFMFWPGQTNTYIADKSEPWEYGWVEFDGILAKELVMQAGLDYNNPVYESFNPEERSRMANAIKCIIDSPDQSPYTLIGYLYIFLDSLVQSSSKRVLKPIGSLSDYYVRKAIAYVGQYYAKDITVQDIADYCNIDRSYLSRIFKASLSKTPTQFIIDFRISRACELLVSDEYTIGEISTMIGYPNQLNFSRAFKREMGQSPNMWRTKAK